MDTTFKQDPGLVRLIEGDLAAGTSPAEIARHYCISRNTVSAIRAKMQRGVMKTLPLPLS